MEFETSRNILHTPCFMPVGTYGGVSGMLPATLAEMGAEILVSNAFRLSEDPGEAIMSKFDNLHEFMAWDRTILTDSGGFQSRLREHAITKEGIQFYDEDVTSLWTPEKAVGMQRILGSDFVMPLDFCVELPTTYAKAKEAMDLTIQWAKRSKAAFNPRPGQILFGIMQGAIYPDLRKRCMEALEQIGFPAYAIGGLNVGESAADYQATIDLSTDLLPKDKLRYIMGVGRPEAMLDAVRAGIDIMDSVIPTKYAREKTVFTYRGPINLFKKRKYRKDKYPIDPNCQCYTCRHVSRAYLHHLYNTTSSTAFVYAAIHNVNFCLKVLIDARQAILEDRFEQFHTNFMDEYTRNRGQD